MKNIEKYMDKLIEAYKFAEPCNFIRECLRKDFCTLRNYECMACLSQFGSWLDEEYRPPEGE